MNSKKAKGLRRIAKNLIASDEVLYEEQQHRPKIVVGLDANGRAATQKVMPLPTRRLAHCRRAVYQELKRHSA